MKKLFTKFALLFTVLVPVLAFAQTQQRYTFLQPVKDLLQTLVNFIGTLSVILPGLAVLAFFLMVLVFILNKIGYSPGGLKVEGKSLIWALVALTALFSVYALIQLLGSVFGIDTNRSKTITAPSLPQVGGLQQGSTYNQ